MENSRRERNGLKEICLCPAKADEFILKEPRNFTLHPQKMIQKLVRQLKIEILREIVFFG